jgi:cyclic-di-GMP-binding biofilm dispersal mediator protein
MTSFAGKHVLVVGASGAFGVGFTNQFIEQGALTSGTAKTAESSVRLRPDLASRLLVDLESPASITALTEYLLSQPLPLDGIVLAAGLVAFGTVEATPPSITARLMQVNALGQIQLVQELLPKLQESAASGRSPFIVSISGVIAEQPMAGLASYSASKTAMHGFAVAAAKDFGKLGIRWIDARPGHTESGLAGRAIFGQAPQFGIGKTVNQVVARIVTAISSDEKDLPSSSF